MIRTLDRYLLTTFFVTYVMSLGILVSLYVVLDLMINIDEFTEHANITVFEVLYNIFDYYLYNIPLYFSQISGVITLFAACGTLVRLQRQNEITAILSSGVSLYRIAAPIVIAGLAMNFLVVLDHEVILPDVAPKLARPRDDVEGQRAYSIWCVKDGPGTLVSAKKFVPNQEAIRQLIVIETSTDPRSRGQLTSVIHADKAYWNAERNGWDLEVGKHYVPKANSRGGLSQTDSIKPDLIDFYPSSLTPKEMQLRQNAQWIQFLSIARLLQLEKGGLADSHVIAQIKHSRFTAPINSMILLMIGMSFFLSRLPDNILSQTGKALATSGVVFLVFFLGQQFVGTIEIGTNMGFIQALPAWLPIFLFGPLAVVMMENVKT